MIINNNKNQKDPSEREIKFILKLFNAKKIIDTKKELKKKLQYIPILRFYTIFRERF